MYKLKTPNPQYNGVTEGVPFSRGMGQTDNKNIRNVLVNDYGYEDITPEPEKTIDEMTVPELKEKAKKLEFTGYNNLKRDELIALIKGDPLEEKQEQEGKESDENAEKADKEKDPV